MLLCSLADEDLRTICRSQYDYPGSTIGYLLEMCLDHVYIVLEPVGSARLTFDDDLYYELCVFDDQSLFGVLGEISNMIRSLEMVKT